METQHIIIGVVIVVALAFIGFLMWQNHKDEKEVEEFLDHNANKFDDEESELNDDK